DAAAPWRWFLHHGILNLRRRGPSPGPDPLVQYSADKQVPFVAFVTALRKLPQQQIEAFILRHGESMKDRELAVAMDCSVTAATTHLAAAEGSLNLVAGSDFGARLADFRTAYDNLSPDPESVKRYVAERVATKTVRRRTRRVVTLVVWIVLLTAIAYGLW